MCKVMVTVTSPDGDIQRLWVTLIDPSQAVTIRVDGVDATETIHFTGRGEHLSPAHRTHKHLRVVRRPA